MNAEPAGRAERGGSGAFLKSPASPGGASPAGTCSGASALGPAVGWAEPTGGSNAVLWRFARRQRGIYEIVRFVRPQQGNAVMGRHARRGHSPATLAERTGGSTEVRSGGHLSHALDERRRQTPPSTGERSDTAKLVAWRIRRGAFGGQYKLASRVLLIREGK